MTMIKLEGHLKHDEMLIYNILFCQIFFSPQTCKLRNELPLYQMAFPNEGLHKHTESHLCLHL